jgi:hypothetical protein
MRFSDGDFLDDLVICFLGVWEMKKNMGNLGKYSGEGLWRISAKNLELRTWLLQG